MVPAGARPARRRRARPTRQAALPDGHQSMTLAPPKQIEARPPVRAARLVLIWGGAIALLALAMLLGVAVGAVNLAPSEVLDGLLNRGNPIDHTIVWDLRLPRVVLAV